MDRAEKIMTALIIVALIAVLLHSHRRRGHRGNLTGVQVNVPDIDDRQRGPAYLLSALPAHRFADDFTEATSYQGAWG